MVDLGCSYDFTHFCKLWVVVYGIIVVFIPLLPWLPGAALKVFPTLPHPVVSLL